MIRINLLRQIGTPASASSSDFAEISPAQIQKQALGKFLGILSLPMALYLFQYIQNFSVQSETDAFRAKKASIDSQRTGLSAGAPNVEKLQAEQAALQSQLSTLKTLGRNRLREVKALDAIQDHMPPRTWLRQIKIANGVVNLQGYASSDEGVPDLMREIERSQLFSDLEPKSTTQEETATGPMKRFEVEFKIGRPEQKPEQKPEQRPEQKPEQKPESKLPKQPATKAM